MLSPSILLTRAQPHTRVLSVNAFDKSHKKSLSIRGNGYYLRKTIVIFSNSTRAKISSNDSGKLSPSPHKTHVNISDAVDLFEILDVPQRF